MTALSAGVSLKSLPGMDDPNFEEVTILLTEYNHDGATGFIINKKFHRRLNELEEFKSYGNIPLYEGGPVDQEHLYFIHRRPDLLKDGQLIYEDVFFGGDLHQAVALVDEKMIGPQDIKIWIGYCGWAYGQLEAEIEEGSWQLVDKKITSVFHE